MEKLDLMSELAPPLEARAQKSPCGCSEQAELSSLTAHEQPSDPDQLMTELQSALIADSGGDELALAGMEADLELLQDLLPGQQSQDLPALSDVIGLAERYPGLKITLSF